MDGSLEEDEETRRLYEALEGCVDENWISSIWTTASQG